MSEKQIKGYTIVMDILVEETSLITAAVYGRIWRFCQMKDRVCNASLDKIAVGIGVDRATALRHIKILVDKGYLSDLTPGLRYRPHTYAKTGKLNIESVAENNTISKSVAENSESVAESQASVAESHLKKVLKKEKKDFKKLENSFSFEEQTQTLEPEQTLSKEEGGKENSITEKNFIGMTEKKADALTRAQVNGLFEEGLHINISGREWDRLAAICLSRGRTIANRFIQIRLNND